MKFSISLLLLSLLAFTGCTSVKVHKVSQGKLPKTQPRQVQQLSTEAVKARPHETIATIDMRTRSPFEANLTQLARERTAKLGGNAYSILSGNSQTTVSGGMGSLFGDSTEATMNIAVIRWTDIPPPEPKPEKKKKPEAAPEPPVPANTRPASQPAAAEQPAPKPKKKPWWKPWAKSEPAPAPAEKPAPAGKPASTSKPKPAASQPAATTTTEPAPQPAKKKSWLKPWSWF